MPDARERERKSQVQMFKSVCDVAKDLSVSAIRGAQVTIPMLTFINSRLRVQIPHKLLINSYILTACSLKKCLWHT